MFLIRHLANLVILGLLPLELDESSGLAVSQCQNGVFWSHNDSGDAPMIYAMDAEAKLLGIWRLSGAENKDWEDMATRRDAAGNCSLYIGDIGNTDRRARKVHRIYRIDEPLIGVDASNDSKNTAALTSQVEVLEFEYPDGRYDAETLMVHPKSGEIYLITKELREPVAVYKLLPEFDGETATRTATRVSDFSVPAIPNGLVSGGQSSSSGTRVVICDYSAGYEISLPEGSTNFDDIWKQAPRPFLLGIREQGEAISYGRDADVVYATSEKRGAKLVEIRRK